MSLIKSVCDTDTQILESISTLYLGNSGFDLDPTYSKGNFYKTFTEPKFKSDLISKFDDVTESDCRNLWYFKDAELSSICFDPPFLFRNRPSKNNDINCKRFSYFKSYEELLDMYRDSLISFHRVLKKKGILAFKCQDMTDNKTYFTHVEVLKIAEKIGFVGVDLFILVAKNRIYHSELKQRHARKFHSYWYVLRKK